MRAGRDPAHVRGPRPRREAPGRPRRELQQRLELAPALAAVVAAEQPARLGAGVHRAVGGADREREDAGFRQRAIDPAPAAVRRASHAAFAQARRRPCPGRADRRRGTARRFRARTARPSTRRPSRRAGRSRPRSPRTGASYGAHRRRAPAPRGAGALRFLVEDRFGGVLGDVDATNVIRGVGAAAVKDRAREAGDASGGHDDRVARRRRRISRSLSCWSLRRGRARRRRAYRPVRRTAGGRCRWASLTSSSGIQHVMNGACE